METSYFLLIYFFVLGSAVGSFLNVVVDRLPSGTSLLGRSRCDGCGRLLSPLELVPIFAYFVLGGKSACCKKPLHINYSLVELTTALAFVVVSYLYFNKIATASFNPFDYWLGFAGLLTITATTIAITLIDFRHQIIPDPLQVVLFAGALVYVYSQESLTPTRFAQALLVPLPILLLYLGTKGRGMGYGDIKLTFTLGFWLGLSSGLVGLYFGFIIGAIYGVILMLMRRAKRKSHIAFGPFLLIGAWLAYYFAPSLIKTIGF